MNDIAVQEKRVKDEMQKHEEHRLERGTIIFVNTTLLTSFMLSSTENDDREATMEVEQPIKRRKTTLLSQDAKYEGKMK